MRSEETYFITALSAIALLLSTHVAIVLKALGWQINIATVVSVGMSLLLAVIGNSKRRLSNSRYLEG
jgi:uncharacterized protein (DUF58 family)